MLRRFIRLAALACALALCAALPASALAERVFDRAGLFSQSEIAQLESAIAEYQRATNTDFVLLTSDSAHAGNSQQQIADEFYDRGGFGVGEDKSGVLYFIDMYDRVPYLSTTGEMIDYLTDERIEAAHERCWNALSRGDYAAAAQRMLSALEGYVRAGVPEGQYRYDVVTGRRLTARHKAITPMELTVTLILSAMVAVIWALGVRSRYMLKGNTYEYNFRDNSDVRLTHRADDYIRTTSVRTRKAQPPSGGGMGGGGHSGGGSGVHSSSGGSSHGGGAGRGF